MNNCKNDEDSSDKMNSTNVKCAVASEVNVQLPEKNTDDKKENAPNINPKLEDLQLHAEPNKYDSQNGINELSLNKKASMPVLQENNQAEWCDNHLLQEVKDLGIEFKDVTINNAHESCNKYTKKNIGHQVDEDAQIKAVSTVLPKDLVIKENAFDTSKKIEDSSLKNTLENSEKRQTDIFFTYGKINYEPKEKRSEKPKLRNNFYNSVGARNTNSIPDSEHNFNQSQVSKPRKNNQRYDDQFKPEEQAKIFSNTLRKVSDDSSIEFIKGKTRNSTKLPAFHTKSKPISIENKSDTSSSPIVPSDEMVNKIIANVESYFIDFNVLKNNFLLKHIRKNKEGFVSLKLITSFRKVRNLTKDWRVVSLCLAKSKMLELNSDKNKVRRIQPIPKIEETSFGKTIVVFNLPSQYASRDQLKELFEKFGKIKSVEIMTPKSKNFNLYHKRCLSFNYNVASKLFGVVEFDKYESVQSALKDEEGYLLKENTMSVVPLVAKFYKLKPKVNKCLPYNFYSPQNGSRTYFSKRDFSRDSYNSYNMRYATYNARDEIARRKFVYEVNSNQWYFRRLAATKNYSKEMDQGYKNKSNILEQKCANCGRVPETWYQNRQLKANTSFNIERRMPYSG